MRQEQSDIFSAELRERQDIPCRLFATAIQRNSLSGAYILTGRQKPDKLLVTKQIAAFLNCQNSDQGGSCLALKSPVFCQNCQWIFHDEHPQALIVLAGEQENKKIPVEKARLLSNELNKTSRYSRIVCIPQAEQDIFHAETANALLKSIEEPPERCHFFLFASSIENVLSTIVSRCQEIPIAGLGQEQDDFQLLQKLPGVIPEAKQTHSFLQEITDGQQLHHKLSLLLEEGIQPEELLDALMTSQLTHLRKQAAVNPAVSLYLQELQRLVQSAKLQLKHYVKEHNVLESFSYALVALRSKHLGEASAKTKLPT
ncbi:MAG: hypothetical protein K2W82_01695 [Candidatus Obscuribacterales bacterium]|nr:hypothetical protein [Candidatus Obscuribacterales bacterium]